ncbi:hypothetical protein [Aureimonas sp. AU4]|nr:hypothetical protein [Aureimonas sp. AU4]
MSSAAIDAGTEQPGGWAMMIVPMMMLFVGCAIFSPKTLLWLFKVKKERR